MGDIVVLMLKDMDEQHRIFFFLLISTWISLKMKLVLQKENRELSRKAFWSQKRIKNNKRLIGWSHNEQLPTTNYVCLNQRCIMFLKFFLPFLAWIVFLINLSIALKMTWGVEETCECNLLFLSAHKL